MRALLTVALLTLACGLLLWTTHNATAERINNARSVALLESLTQLAGARRLATQPNLQQWPIALCEGLTLVRAPARGYGGAIDLLLALQQQSPHGLHIANLEVVRHQETPGIGDFIAEGGNNRWLQRFVGATAPTMATRPLSVDAVSGATITVKAVRLALATTLAIASSEAVNQTALPFNQAPCSATGTGNDDH